eukprot:4521676-Prymnesium_polylepis.1
MERLQARVVSSAHLEFEPVMHPNLHLGMHVHIRHPPLLPQFWWEVASLIERTVLTGWLLLVNSEVVFLRLLIALLVFLFFLVEMFASDPYKQKLDYAMAASCQLLFV